jgi:hypothetical protein
VGTLGALDPDVGQTHTFAVLSDGCGGQYADGAGSFTVNAGALVTTTPLDFETKSSYSVCVRVTDSGSPAQSFDQLLTIAVGDVSEAPAGGGTTPPPPGTRPPTRLPHRDSTRRNTEEDPYAAEWVRRTRPRSVRSGGQAVSSPSPAPGSPGTG